MPDRKITITINPKIEGDKAIRTTLDTSGGEIKGSEFAAAIYNMVSFVMDQSPSEEKYTVLTYMQDLILSVYESKK